MRARTDPLGLLFFAYPFVLSFVSAIVYDHVKAAFTGPGLAGQGSPSA
jgi:hypothetical protein